MFILPFISSVNGQSVNQLEDRFFISSGLQYAYFEYGRLNGISFPFCVHYKFGKRKAYSVGLGFRFAYGESNWNYEGRNDRLYNLDINGEVPPYNFFGGTSFLYDYNIDLKGVTGHGFNFYFTSNLSRDWKIGSQSFRSELGFYLLKSNTSFIAGYIENAIYESYWPEVEGEFLTDFLFPIWVRYLDAGPYLSLKFGIFKNWRTPLGFSMSYYHGFHKNSTIYVGLYFDLGF